MQDRTITMATDLANSIANLTMNETIEKKRAEATQNVKPETVGQGPLDNEGEVSPKLDPVVGIRYLYYPKRLYTRITQIWMLLSECMGLVGEFYLNPSQTLGGSIYGLIPVSTSQWVWHMSEWGNVTLKNLVAYANEKYPAFEKPHQKYAQIYNCFRGNHIGWAERYCRVLDEVYEVWVVATNTNDPEAMYEVMNFYTKN